MQAPRRSWPSWTTPVLLAGVCALLYGMTLSAPLLYDDAAMLPDNPLLVLPWSAFLRGLFSRGYFWFAIERTYQPLVTLFHYAAGPRPPLYRAAGIALHALNAWLVFRLGRRLKLGDGPALAAALLFCASPSATEAVNFSVYKGHLLAAAFGLAFLDDWLDFLERGTNRALAAAAGFYALALSSKETAVAFGALAAAAWLCFGPRRERVAGLWLLAGETGAYLAFRFLWLRPPPALPSMFHHSPLLSLAWYLRALVWPWPLCLEHTLTAGPWAAAALGGWLAAVWVSRRRPARLWLAFWPAIAALPFLHFVAFANHSPVADRYLYAPIAGFSLFLADLAGAGVGAWALSGLALAWFACSAARNGLYRSERGLYEQTVACAPDNVKSHWLLGVSRLRGGDGASAQLSFERALALSDDPELHGLLGQALAAQGKTAEADRELARAKPASR